MLKSRGAAAFAREFHLRQGYDVTRRRAKEVRKHVASGENDSSRHLAAADKSETKFDVTF